MSSSLTHEEKFTKNIQDFMTFGESLLTECYESKITSLNPAGIGYAIIFVNERIKEKGHTWMIEEFIKRTATDWKEIKEQKHEHFIKKLPELVPILQKEHADELCRVFVGKDSSGNHLLNEEDREAFWEYLVSFVKLALKYVHHGRKPVKHEEGFKYSATFFGDVKVKDNAKLFELELKL
jgi:hypothetical protein